MKTRLIAVLPLALAAAMAQEPVRYTVRFPAPQTHYLQVEASIPAGQSEVELFMPVWTPGSYLVREYARNVEDFEARAGAAALRWEKSRKNRWKVFAGGAPRIDVSYRVYARESSVQGNWVDAGFAMLNGAPNFMTLVGGARRHEVKLILPEAWKRSISGMAEPHPNEYVAADYDELVDSPIYCGNAPIHEFVVAGKKHYLVNEGEGPMWDGPASARDVQKVVEEYARMWSGLPYEKYVFFNMLVEAGGGLEHKTSTWMNGSHWAYGNTLEPQGDAAAPGARRANRVGWLGLVSHEYFHLWNVKRLRPVELGPFDYEREVYSRSLWIAEGVTSYYSPLAVKRAGLRSTESLLRDLSQNIRQLQSQPGRLVQPLENSSYDAWIKLYRPDENSTNTSISYYTKGALVGWLLDARIRAQTGGRKSLDDVMTLAYARYSGARGYTPAEFRQTAAEVAGSDLGGWFEKVLDTTAELDYSEALDYLGLRFKSEPQRPGTGIRYNTGLTTRSDNGRLVVSQVRRGTPGEDAGINVNDEILAVNDYRVRPEQWPVRLEAYKPGETVSLLLTRRDRLIKLDLKLEAEKTPGWTLEVRPDATAEQKAHLKAWVREP